MNARPARLNRATPNLSESAPKNGAVMPPMTGVVASSNPAFTVEKWSAFSKRIGARNR